MVAMDCGLEIQAVTGLAFSFIVQENLSVSF